MSFSFKSKAIVGVVMGSIYQPVEARKGCVTHGPHEHKFCPECGVESKTIPLNSPFDPRFVSFAEKSGFTNPSSFYQALLNEDAGPLAIFQSSNPMGSYGPMYLGIVVSKEDYHTSLSLVMDDGHKVSSVARELGFPDSLPCIYVIQEIF